MQAYYSLRCIPQIYGPVAETLENARRIIEEELQAANDNPIIDVDSANVYHGGNFHGDYISMEQDKVKMAMTRVAMTAERQLNYLLHDRLNGILPPFLCMATPGLDYALQAYQFTATSTTAECQTLAMPNYVHSIPNNQDNQDNQQGRNDNQQNQDQQNNQDQQDSQDGRNGQQPQPVKISPQQAQQMLKAMQAKEKETQDKVNREKAEALKSRQKEKNW